MIIADLPCLEQLGNEKIIGKGKHSYSKSIAFTGSSADDYRVYTISSKYAKGFRISVVAGKYASGFNISTGAGASIQIGSDFAKSSSFAFAISS